MYRLAMVRNAYVQVRYGQVLVKDGQGWSCIGRSGMVMYRSAMVRDGYVQVKDGQGCSCLGQGRSYADQRWSYTGQRWSEMVIDRTERRSFKA